MKRMKSQGFGLLGLLAIVGIIVVAALIGWYVYQHQQKSDETTALSTQTTQPIPDAPAVSQTSDLEKAAQALDKTQIDSSVDTAQLDKELAAF